MKRIEVRDLRQPHADKITCRIEDVPEVSANNIIYPAHVRISFYNETDQGEILSEVWYNLLDLCKEFDYKIIKI